MTSSPGANTNAQSTGADLYGWLKRQADSRRQQIVVLNKEIGDLEAAMAAVAARQPTPAPPKIDRRDCAECGGPLVVQQGLWVHDRDGENISCKPGHSGPVGHPLEQTKSFPQVTPQNGTQIIPAVPALPWEGLLGVTLEEGQSITVHWARGGQDTGT